VFEGDSAAARLMLAKKLSNPKMMIATPSSRIASSPARYWREYTIRRDCNKVSKSLRSFGCDFNGCGKLFHLEHHNSILAPLGGSILCEPDRNIKTSINNRVATASADVQKPHALR